MATVPKKFVNREGFVQALGRRFSIRLHSSLMLAAATTSGLMVSKGLLWMGLAAPYIRFPIAVLAGYGLFLLFVNWWLHYVGMLQWSQKSGLADGVDAGSSSGGGSWSGGGSSSGGGGGVMRGGGGSFDGGGASSSFEAVGGKVEGGAAARGLVAGSVSQSASASGGGGGGGGDGDGGSSLDGAGSLLPVLFIVAIVVGLAFAIGWVVVVTPDVLMEVATEVAVASGMIRSTARTRDQTWFTLLFVRSIPKAALLAFLAVLLGVGVRWLDPTANTIGQLTARYLGS